MCNIPVSLCNNSNCLRTSYISQWGLCVISYLKVTQRNILNLML